MTELLRPAHPQHSKEDLAALRERLSRIGPGWTLAEGAEGLLRAERPGTERHQQAAMRPEALIDAVAQREAQISPGARVNVTEGVVSTEDLRR